MKLDFRDALAAALVLLWTYMVVENPHEPLIVGAMIGIVSGGIVGFYFGAAKKDAHAQPVTVENGADNPVPVEPAA